MIKAIRGLKAILETDWKFYTEESLFSVSTQNKSKYSTYSTLLRELYKNSIKKKIILKFSPKVVS